MVKKTAYLAGLALGLIAVGAPAREALGQARDTTPVELEPIVVTVAGAPSFILGLPYAVSIGGDSSVTRAQPRLALGEIMTALPGIEVQNRYNYALGDRLSIRGFGARTQFGIRGVRVLVDGVPATMADGQTTLDHLDLATVSRIETWRGPSSALYGNASGGVVRYRTGYPVTGPFRQGFSAEGGSNGLLRVESRTAGTLGQVTGELDISLFSYDGYRAHSAADKAFGTARLGYETAGGRDRFRLVLNGVDLRAQNPGSIGDSALAANPEAANPFNVVQQTGKDAQQLQAGLTWTHQTGAGSLEFTGWGLGRKLTNPIPVAVIDLDRTAAGLRGQWNHGVGLGGRLGLVLVGIETAYQDDDR
jgi:iron complex outermembrane receptor protein